MTAAVNSLRPDPTPLVGVIGKKRSGKDSFASTLVGERGFRRFAFADPLKRAVLGVDPIVRVEQDETYLLPIGTSPAFLRLSWIIEAIGWEAAKEIREVRRLLQEYGVKIREIDEDFWVRATMEPVEDVRRLPGGSPVVITDVRFPNEVEAVRRAGGTVVRVLRPGLESTDTHISETALDDVEADVTIYNAGTLEDLARQARALAL